MTEFAGKFCRTSFKYRLSYERPCWAAVIRSMDHRVCGCSTIVKSLPALDPHTFIVTLCQETTITEFSNLIYTLGKESSEHGDNSTP